MKNSMHYHGDRGNESKVVPLGDYCLKIGSGATPRGGSGVYMDTGETCLIRSQNIYNSGFKPQGIVYIDKGAANKLKNVVVHKNDILLNITGDSVARVCLAITDYLPARVNQHVAIIRPNPKEFDARYLRYVLSSAYMQKELLNLASAGATRNALTKTMIETLDVSKPPLEIQVAIADNLESFDNKIELNNQTNQTLEQMAQTLFKSWFVDFDPVFDNLLAKVDFDLKKLPSDFPAVLLKRAQKRLLALNANKSSDETSATGISNKAHLQAGIQTNADNIHQHFPCEFEHNEQLGWIPKGWEYVSLESIIKLIGGGTPKTTIEEYWSGNIPWFSVVDAPVDSDVFVINTQKHVTQLGVDKSSTKILRVGTTIISARGTVGKCAFVGTPMAMNQSCYGINGKNNISDEFIYYLTRHQVSELQKRGHGSVFNTITRDTFKSILLAFSGEKLTIEFSRLVSSFFDKILVNNKQNVELTKLRGTLLPKLISGELDLPCNKLRQK